MEYGGETCVGGGVRVEVLVLVGGHSALYYSGLCHLYRCSEVLQ